MAKMAGVGSKVCLWPFRYFGVDTFFVPEQGTAEEILKGLVASKEYAVIFVTEKVYHQAQELIEAQRENYLPAITLIPDLEGSEGLALERITDAIRTAVGLDIA